MRVLLIKGQSQYGGLRLFADLAAEAFRAAGHTPEVLDLAGRDAQATLDAHSASHQTDLVFTMSILGEYRDPQGRSLGETYRAPHVLWMTDYALRDMPRLAATPAATGLLVVDPTQADALRATFGPDHFPNLGFFPHPAVGRAAPDDPTPEAFASNRPIELLWSGTFQRPDIDWTALPANLQRPLQDAVDLALAVEWMAPHTALIEVLRSRGVDATAPEARGVIQLAAYVDEVVRKTRRLAFVTALAATGIPLHICGHGWEPQLHRFRNATCHGPVEMTRMVELMRRSRVVLNTNGNFGAGSHERPFSASLAGAATFSDHSRYYDQAFAPGEIETYRWKDLAGAMTALADLVGHPRRAFGMAQAAKARTLAEHTWDRRIGLILQAAGLEPAALAA